MDARAEASAQTLYVDTRQQAGKHRHKDDWWASHGVSTVHVALAFGDYARDGSNVVVDTKRNIEEVAQNVTREHDRFSRECVKARDAGCRLVILVEDGRYADPNAIAKWTNTHCRKCPLKYKSICDPRGKGKCPRHKTRKPIQGPQLLKTIRTFEEHYGIKFEFVKSAESAKRICELLGLEVRDSGE